MYSLEQIETEVLEYLDEEVFPGQSVIEQAIPDLETVVRRANGSIAPYVAVELGDIQPWGSRSFVGPQGDDYVLPIYLRIVAGDPAIARRLRTRGVQLFLGATFDWAGDMRKRNSGGMFPMKNSDGAVECYIAPASFGIVVQLSEIPEP